MSHVALVRSACALRQRGTHSTRSGSRDRPAQGQQPTDKGTAEAM